MLWQYVLDHDPEHLAAQLYEPQVGNPPHVPFQGKLISQDLANSLLEFKAIMDTIGDPESITRIMELGAGYGRNAYVFLKLMPNVKYIVVDIPPALYISERYLSDQFADRKIFRFRPFDHYAQIAEDFERADIAFLLPHQLELLPDKFVNLFINISSLHEMRYDQISYYFHLIDRLTQNYFYTKQWKISHIPFDNIIVRESDYPIPEKWIQIYSRQCAVQTEFFEALFALAPI
jgi:putative sugar O-methyltransferase